MGVIEPELGEQRIGLIGAADAEIRVMSDGRADPVQRGIGSEGRRIGDPWREIHIVAAWWEPVGSRKERAAAGELALGALEEVEYVERGFVLQEAPSREDAWRRDQRFLGLRGGPNDGGVIKRVDSIGQTTRNRGLQPPRDVDLADAAVEADAAERLPGIGIGLLDGEAGELLPRPEASLSQGRARRIAIREIAPWHVLIELGEVSPHLASEKNTVILVAGVNGGEGLGDRRYSRVSRIVEVAVAGTPAFLPFALKISLGSCPVVLISLPAVATPETVRSTSPILYSSASAPVATSAATLATPNFTPR